MLKSPHQQSARPCRQPKARAFIYAFRSQNITNPITGRVPADASGYFKRSYRKCLIKLHNRSLSRLALPIGIYRLKGWRLHGPIADVSEAEDFRAGMSFETP